MKYIEVIEDFLGQQEEDTKKAYRKKYIRLWNIQ